MAKKAVPYVDITGLFKEDAIVDETMNAVVEDQLNEEDGMKTIGYFVPVAVPGGLFHPKWDFEQEAWVEGLTIEEIEDRTKVPDPIPTETDMLAERLIAQELSHMESQTQITSLQKKLESSEAKNAEMVTAVEDLNMLNGMLGEQIVASDLKKAQMQTTIDAQQTTISTIQTENKELKTVTDMLGERLVILELGNMNPS